MSVAVEGAHEGVVVTAHHGSDGDVVHHLGVDGLVVLCHSAYVFPVGGTIEQHRVGLGAQVADKGDVGIRVPLSPCTQLVRQHMEPGGLVGGKFIAVVPSLERPVSVVIYIL